MTQLQVLELVYRALQTPGGDHIDDVVLDRRSDDSEIVITTYDCGVKEDWVIRACDITEADRSEL
jgi:hypothetical protein